MWRVLLPCGGIPGTKAVIFMFTGEYEHNIDAKGRVIIPAKFREELGSFFYITKEQDHCLGVYKKEIWEAYAAKLDELPTTNETVRRFKRFRLAGASECIPDGNGRIMIPPPLRAYAGITKEIVSIGNGNRVEIWDKEKWKSEQDSFDFNEDDLKDLEKFGI